MLFVLISGRYCRPVTQSVKAHELSAPHAPDPDYLAKLARVRAAAGVLIFDERDRVMLVHTTYKNQIWELPGGVLEIGESPAEAALRELKEEIGYAPASLSLLCVDWVPPSPPADGSLQFLFDGGTITASGLAEIQLDPRELQGFEFVDAAKLESMLIQRLSRRVLSCLAMRGKGGIYLEDGLSLTV